MNGTTLNSNPSMPSLAGGMPMSPHDRDAVIRTIAAEAGSEPPAGQAAVTHVIMNRVAAGGYGNSPAAVVQKPGEFSTWNGVTGFAHGKEGSKLITAPVSQIPNYNTIGSMVDKVYNGLIPDPTNGATHYYAPGSMSTGKPPPWAGALAAQNSVKVGTQIFVGGTQGPGQDPPGTTLNSIAGGPQDVGMFSG
jgi:conjugal transfer mating pair stabilization protein TraG